MRGMDGTQPGMQRARGSARVAFDAAGLRDLRQEGCAKAMLPRAHGRREVVFLNTSGGLTGGDRLAYALRLGAGAATATTQTAERAYASAGGVAEVRVDLAAGPGTDLAWLPQETILYDGCALERRTRIDMGEGARVLACEMLVLGRLAMGERVRRLDVCDRREIRAGGRPLWVEPLRLSPEALSPSAALLGGATALASVVLAGQGAEDAGAALRARLAGAGDGLEAAVSAWDGRTVLRMRAADPAPMRRALAATLSGLVTLPRVWPR